MRLPGGSQGLWPRLRTPERRPSFSDARRGLGGSSQPAPKTRLGLDPCRPLTTAGGWSAGNYLGSVADAAAFTYALYGAGSVVSNASLAQMINFTAPTAAATAAAATTAAAAATATVQTRCASRLLCDQGHHPRRLGRGGLPRPTSLAISLLEIGLLAARRHLGARRHPGARRHRAA